MKITIKHLLSIIGLTCFLLLAIGSTEDSGSSSPREVKCGHCKNPMDPDQSYGWNNTLSGPTGRGKGGIYCSRECAINDHKNYPY